MSRQDGRLRPRYANQRDLKYLIRALLAVLIFCLIAILISAWAAATQPDGTASDFLDFVGTSFLVGGAASLAGIFLGFLFGIPKTIYADAPADSAPDGTPGDTSTANTHRANTNLEEISDWLTKIIVGVGLASLSDAPTYFGNLVDFFSQNALSKPVVGALIILLGMTGFLGGYLITRMFLAGALSRADRQITKVDANQIEILEEEIDLDERLGGSREYSEDVRRAASSILQLSLDDLEGTDALVAWAKAKVTDGQYSDALAALRRAVDLRPRDPELRRQYASTLTLADRFDDAVKELQAVINSEGTRRRTRSKASINLVLTYLYQPNGYQNAIDVGEEMAASKEFEENPLLWRYIAAAYGQKHDALTRQGAGDDAILKARDNAYRAAEKAIKFGGVSERRFLRTLWDPEDAHRTAGEDDLYSLHGDDGFSRLLGPG